MAKLIQNLGLTQRSHKLLVPNGVSTDRAIALLQLFIMKHRNEFSQEGAARASDVWNYTTVKRILKNPVYLGHTLLGKSKKVSVKSKKKVPVPRDDWAVTENTHPPLVTKRLFERAQQNLGRGSRDYRAYDQVRKSIFSGIAVCAKCGYSLCSCGTVYKGSGRSTGISPVPTSGRTSPIPVPGSGCGMLTCRRLCGRI